MADMTSADHYNAAEKLLEEAETCHEPDTRAEWCLELAKMHLALSQASIAAKALDRRAQETAKPSPGADTEPEPDTTNVRGSKESRSLKPPLGN